LTLTARSVTIIFIPGCFSSTATSNSI